MNNENHNRRKLRLKDYDYAQAGYYFITICVENGQCILCRGEQCSPEDRKRFELSKIGEIVDEAINNIEKYYDNIRINNYVIMPNHIHLIIVIDGEDNGRTMFAPTVSRVIK